MDFLLLHGTSTINNGDPQPTVSFKLIGIRTFKSRQMAKYRLEDIEIVIVCGAPMRQ
jgi:hypothetical protein